MATPEGKDYPASLFDFSGRTISKLVRDSVPVDQKILDIGAGWAKYAIILNEYEMDAIEAWEPYVHKMKLHMIYNLVYVMKAEHFEYPCRYGAVILGDVLEHMTIRAAQRVIRAACEHSKYVYVAVPFMMPQHEEDGNPLEVHIQEDLNEEAMAARYPELRLHALAEEGGHTKAIYVKAE